MNHLLPTILLGFAAQTRQPIVPERPSIEQELDSLAPHAEGIAEVEVIEVRGVNQMASDGDYFQEVGLRILRATGATRDKLQIVIAVGGLGPDGPVNDHFKPHGPLHVDDFKKGSRYWIAFSSQYDWKRCPQGVVAWWPDEGAPKVLEEAIRGDRYAEQPQYEPRSGFTHGYRVDKEKGVWRVRMERDGALLWEIELPGERFEAAMTPGNGLKFPGEWTLMERKQWTTGFEAVDPNVSGWYLFAEGLRRLDDANPYGLPAGDHRITWTLDADSGKTAAIWISHRLDLRPTRDPGLVQYLDTKSGRVKQEERSDWIPTGHLDAGGRDPGYLRKVVRTFDPGTGELKGEATYRCDRSEFVLVEKK